MDSELPGYKSDEPPTKTFFLLFKYTETGLATLVDQPGRSQRASDIVTSAGGHCSFYLTAGGCYDMVSVITGLDEVQLARLVLALDALGTVRTTVLTGLRFRADQWAAFISSLPGPGGSQT